MSRRLPWGVSARFAVVLVGTSLIGACSKVPHERVAALAVAPQLGSAESFTVLGSETVTNTGPTTVTGNLGVSPGSAVTGFPPGLVSGGAIHAADAVAQQARDDLSRAYDQAAAQPCDFDQTGRDLGGQTLVPGVYCFQSSAQLTGALVLDTRGDPGAIFIFQVGSALTTASDSSVSVLGGSGCNVSWQIGSSATLGSRARIAGTILARTSITLDTGATLDGRALAHDGAVTLDSNEISSGACGGLALPDGATAPVDMGNTSTPDGSAPPPADGSMPSDLSGPTPDASILDMQGDAGVCTS